MDDKRVYIHIGYHKTASTSLQRSLFPYLTGCRFLTHGGRWSKSIFRLLANDLMYSSDDDYLSGTFTAFLSDQLKHTERALMLSHEGFSGSVFENSYNWERNATRLKLAVPDARIIVVIRHQGTMLRSLYSQHLRHGGYATFHDFVDPTVSTGDAIDFDHLCYDRLIGTYRDLFGADRVLVLAFENLVSNPSQFLGALGEFVGIHADTIDGGLPTHGRALSATSQRILRRYNRWFRRTSLNPQPSIFTIPRAGEFATVLHEKVDPRLPRRLVDSRAPDDGDSARLDYFRESNRRLVEMTGLPLASYGYPLPAG